VNSRPAIIYTTYYSYELCYIAANDPAGRHWGLPAVIDMNAGSGAFMALNNRPALAYFMPGGSDGRPVRFATYY